MHNLLMVLHLKLEYFLCNRAQDIGNWKYDTFTSQKYYNRSTLEFF